MPRSGAAYAAPAAWDSGNGWRYSLHRVARKAEHWQQPPLWRLFLRESTLTCAYYPVPTTALQLAVAAMWWAQAGCVAAHVLLHPTPSLFPSYTLFVPTAHPAACPHCVCSTRAQDRGRVGETS